MLLPNGRCYSHYRVVWVGRCYCHGRWNSQGSFIIYLSLSSEMLARTSSQTCGRWYLPTFLFKDGSLTLMYIASLIVLIWFKSSLPTISKLLMVTLWPLMLLWSCMGEGDFRCSLNLSPNVLEDSPIYSSSQSTLSQWYLYMNPLSFSMGSLSFGAIRRFWMVVPPLQCTCTPNFLPMFLMFSLSPA